MKFLPENAIEIILFVGITGFVINLCLHRLDEIAKERKTQSTEAPSSNPPDCEQRGGIYVNDIYGLHHCVKEFED